MFFDGASRGSIGVVGDNTNKSSGIDVTPDNGVIMYSLTLTEGHSNNETEYEALIAVLKLALEIPIDDLMVYGDLKLVIR